DLARDLDVAHEVREEEDGPFQDPDEQQVAVGVLGAHLLPERAYALLEVVGLDEDLADLGVAHLASDYMKPHPDATSWCAAGLLEGNDHHRPRRGDRGEPPRQTLRRARRRP